MNPIKPIFLMAGGNWRNPKALLPVLKSILVESGKEKPRVAYVGAASGDDPMFFRLLSGMLKAAGAADTLRILLAKAKHDPQKAREQLQSADAVFISGGDVEEGMRWINHHGLARFFQDLYSRGILFFGLSAGSIMLGRQWVRWQDPKDDRTAELFDCMQLAPLVCDTHAEKEAWEELRAAMLLQGKGGLGYGIPTGGVLRVESRGKLMALAKPIACFANRNGQVVRIEDLPASPK